MKKHFKILVVDDEETVLEAYDTVLSPHKTKSEEVLIDNAKALFGDSPTFPGRLQKRFSADLLPAQQGKDAVQIVKESVDSGNPISMAFIDMRMPPGIDGLETARQILEQDDKIEIVFVTAYSDYSLEDIGKTIGKSRYYFLKKPFDPEEIIQLAETLTFRWDTEKERELLEGEKQQFIKNMSHEIRQPLHVILGACNSILSCKTDEEHRNKFVRYIQEEAYRLTRLAENLKFFNQMGGGRVELTLEPVDVLGLAQKAVELLAPEATRKGIDLSIQNDGVNDQVMGDMDKLMQVLINLIVNAIKYTSKGTIQLQLSYSGDRVEVAVQDTGNGIPEAEQQLIFNKFYRCRETATKVRGHGLGLSISQDIIQAFGSDIQISSSPGVGSRFSFTLQTT